ncbi:MAG TPA: M56 family metallopeptidase, partial [Planctomycetaceae bacterium]
MWTLCERTALELARGSMAFGLNWLLQSTLLISAGLLCGYLLRRHGAAAQSAVYRTTLLAAVALPPLTGLLSLGGFSGWSIEIPASWSPLVAERLDDQLLTDRLLTDRIGGRTRFNGIEFDPGAAASRVGSAAPVTVGDGRETSGMARPTSSTLGQPATRASLPAPATVEHGSRFSAHTLGLAALALSLLWVSIAIGLLALLAEAWWRLGRIRKSAVPVDSATVGVCQAYASKLGVTAPAVMRTPFLPSPCLAGIRRPVVLLPEEKAPLPLDDIFIHELAHLSRKDCHWNFLCNLATAVFWFHPLLWGLARRLKMAAEEVCDDFVVEVRGNRREYAEGLIDFAEFSAGPMAMAGVAIVSLRSKLARRVTRIMDTSRGLSTSASGWVLACTLVGGVVGTGVVGFVGAAPPAAAAPEEAVAPEQVVAAPEQAGPAPKQVVAAPEPAAAAA